MKKLKAIIILILSLIGIIILSVGSFVLIGAIQAKLFLPQEYIMWIFKSPSSRLVFIYEWYIIFGFAYIFSKDYRCKFRHYSGDIHNTGIQIPGAGGGLFRNIDLAACHRADYAEPFEPALLSGVCRGLFRGDFWGNNNSREAFTRSRADKNPHSGKG